MVTADNYTDSQIILELKDSLIPIVGASFSQKPYSCNKILHIGNLQNMLDYGLTVARSFLMIYELWSWAFSSRKQNSLSGICSVYHQISQTAWEVAGGTSITVGVSYYDMTGMLLGQNLPRRLPTTASSRILVAIWLVFALILGSAYRGNLTASLTIPKFPPRAETVQELVDTANK